MINTDLSLSIPNEWEEHFLIKRIDEEDIKITLEERNGILNALDAGSRFVQIGKYTIMINAIKSIDPFYEPYNIPPKPEEEIEISFLPNGNAEKKVKNQNLIDLWVRTYSSTEAIEGG